MGSGLIYANPTGGVVTGGATLSELGDTLTINQVDQRVIIQWDSFSIALGEVTNFDQPAGGTALNRVMLANPSEIFGQLTATGNVILINPNGILVGATGQIDTAGFMASTLDVSNEQFLAGGDLRFNGSSDNGVTNLGSITAREGDIFLLGSSVTNVGTLTAANGTVGLAAGDQILVSATGDERVFVEVSSGGKVEHSGEIRAAIAELKAMGTDPNVIAVSVEGLVEVTGVQRVGGKVYLSGGEGKVFVNAPIEAKPAPEADPISGTLVKIGGGDLEFRETEIQAFGPGQADIDLDAVRDILMVNATVGTVDATTGTIDIIAGNDLTANAENDGNMLIGGAGASGDVDITIRAGRDAVFSANGSGFTQVGYSAGDGDGDGPRDGYFEVTGIRSLYLNARIFTPNYRGGSVTPPLAGLPIFISPPPIVIPPRGAPDDGSIVIGTGGTPPDPVVNVPTLVSSVPMDPSPTSGPTSIVNVTSTVTEVRTTTTAVRTVAANAVIADSNQRAPRQEASQPQSSVSQGVKVDGGDTFDPAAGEHGGVNTEAFKEMFDPSGSRNFVETRIGG